MIVCEPLRRDHLESFVPAVPLSEAIPEEQIGAAAVYVKDGEVLAIVGGWGGDGVAEVGMAVSVEGRRYPVSMHRLALELLHGVHLMGYTKIVAEPPSDERATAWLLRLGFTRTEKGFEKCRRPP